jgi:hypothetical protein
MRNFFVELLRSWKEDVRLLTPSELSLAGLLIANKTRMLYKYLWWLVLGMLAWCLYGNASPFLSSLVFSCFGMVSVMVSRPSVLGPENIYKEGQKLFIAGGAILLSTLITVYGMPLLSPLLGMLTHIFLFPLAVLLVLCMLDAHFSFSALCAATKRAIKLCLYHYPFFIMVYGCSWYLLYTSLRWLLTKLLYVMGVGMFFNASCVASALIFPLFSAAVVYGYIRFLREHMDYYYA